MCVVLQHILARGPAARPRCIPPALAPPGPASPPKPSAAAEAHSQSQQTVSPVNLSQTFGRCITGQGASKLPDTPWPGAFLPRWTPDHAMEANSWRRLHRDQEGRIRLSLSVDHPIDQGAFEPLWNPDHSMEANRPPIGCRQRVAAEHDQGYAALDRTNALIGSSGHPLDTLTSLPHSSTTICTVAINKCVSIGYTLRMNKDSGLRIRVERSLRERFVEVCREQDKPAAQVIREFMREYISANEAKQSPPTKADEEAAQ